MTRAILALDQGTTGSAGLVFSEEGAVLAQADREITQIYPRPGWVEHDPEEIYRATVAAGREALAAAAVEPSQVAAIGIANQRETTVVWEKATGRPIHNAVVWQSRASSEICEKLRAAGLEPLIRERTGLLVDAYFSGTKIRWLLDRIDGAQLRAERGELLFGTIETWLLWKLTAGRVHATDVANASRTLLLDIGTGDWDDDLLAALRVPRAMLPKVVLSSQVYAETEAEVFSAPLPVAGMAGDQQAALFGQACFSPGEAKNTYGTGCFLLVHTGTNRRHSEAGLLSTIAWDIGQGIEYALEGSAFTTGAAVQWLRDGLGIIESASETESLAASIPDNGGVYLVPAFAGLGAPHWDMYARGLAIGLTGGTTRAHLARAVLESIAHQSADLVDAMQAAGDAIAVLKVDGGGTANGWLMQFQADVLNRPVEVAAIQETTAFGAAALAGLAVGAFPSMQVLRETVHSARRYEPRMLDDERQRLRQDWRRAVERSKRWAG